MDTVVTLAEVRTVAAGAGAEEAAWRTAVEAAPWLVGTPGETVPPQHLYDKLKPFEERVAADIENADPGGRDRQ